jgi:NTE family protein
MAGRRILVLGGGAPNLTLMSGALLAFHDNGLTFDVVSMAGGGAVVGLSYLAPKGLTPAQALRNTMNLGVSDAIYSMLPINYKVFFKDGFLADVFRNYWRQLPPVQYAEHQYGMSRSQKLEADLLLLAGSLLTPLDITPFSQAMCAHVPFIEDIIDFEKLNRPTQPRCFLNAYCVDTQEVVEFQPPNIDIRHFRAAFSYPYIYGPYEIDGHFFYEGASFSSLNLIRLAIFSDYLNIQYVANVDVDADRFILFDVLGTDLIHPAKDMMDAYGQSIMLPSVANAGKELSIFNDWLKTGYADVPKGEWRLKAAIDSGFLAGKVPNATKHVVHFPVPVEEWPYMADWSRSNLERLFDIGYESGLIFLEDHPGI